MKPLLLILVLIVAGFMVWWAWSQQPAKSEKFCNCTGATTMTALPTYYVYRPTGDVSSYENTCDNRNNVVVDMQQQPLLEFTNGGWKTTAGVDSTADYGILGNSWTAGGGCNTTSVPFSSLASPPMSQNISYVTPGAILGSTSSAVPYAQNYGTSSCASMRTVASPPANPVPCLINAPIRQQEPLVDCCQGSNAYNMAVGVL
jgi:hypothetical protein